MLQINGLYVVMMCKTNAPELFTVVKDVDNVDIKTLLYETYKKVIQQSGKRSSDAILPVQIAYFSGLRPGEDEGVLITI